MPNDNEEIIDSQNDTDTTVNDTNDQQDDYEQDSYESDRVAKLEKELATLKAQKDHWRKKAEKPADSQKITSQNEFSPFDLVAIAKAGLEEEDVSSVMEYAKFKNISLSEALKSNIVKSMLSESAENRKVAQAANTGAVRRGFTKLSDDALLANARKGIMPDSDEDIARLTLLRRK